MKTTKATEQLRQNALIARQEKRTEIRNKVFKLRCTCDEDDSKQGCCKDGVYTNICMSKKSLAKLLKELGIKTIKGQDNWQATQITRLFPEMQNQTNEVGNKSEPVGKVKMKNSLDGLI